MNINLYVYYIYRYWARGPGPGPGPGPVGWDPGQWARDTGQYVRYWVRTYRTVLRTIGPKKGSIARAIYMLPSLIPIRCNNQY